MDCRIGHDAGDFRYVLAFVLQDFDDVVINPVLLDRAAAVDQDDFLTVFLQFAVEVFQCIFAKIEFRRIAVCEIP